MDFETTPDNDLILDVEKATNRGSLNRRVKFTKMGPLRAPPWKPRATISTLRNRDIHVVGIASNSAKWKSGVKNFVEHSPAI